VIEVPSSSPDRGLQHVRTSLAWTRTSLAIVVSGVLVLLKDRAVVDPGALPLRAVTVIAAMLLASTVFTAGALRRRALAARPLPEQVRARRAVFVAGGSVITLAVVTATYLIAGA
jgi:uncharacterized membrane protein YidH (DUF202 family)